jgi:hypothetical protein
MRTVVEDSFVSTVIDQVQALYPRLDDAFEALKWWLSHRPESGEIIDDENWLYKQSGNKDKDIPALVVVYTFNSWQVILKFVLVRVPSL